MRNKFSCVIAVVLAFGSFLSVGMANANSKDFLQLAKKEFDQAKYEKAIAYLNQELALRLKKYGEIHIDTAHVYNNIATALFKKRELNKAIEFYQKVVKILKQIDSKHPKLSETYLSIALVFKQKGDRLKSREMALLAIKTAENSMGENSSLAMYVKKHAGNILGEEKKGETLSLLRSDANKLCAAFNPKVDIMKVTAYLANNLQTKSVKHILDAAIVSGNSKGVRSEVERLIQKTWGCKYVQVKQVK